MTLLKKSLAWVLAVVLILPGGAALPAWAAETAYLTSLEVSPDQVQVLLSEEAEYNAFTTASPSPRVVLELMGAENSLGAKSWAGKGKYLKGVRVGQFQRSPAMIARVVMDLSEPAGYKVLKEDNVLTVRLGPDPEGKPRPKVQVPAAAGPAREAGGVNTQAASELAAMAAKSDVNIDEQAAKEPPPTPEARPAKAGSGSPRAPRADIMSRLPKDPVSLDFDGTDIKDIIKLLSAKAKINIIYGPDVNGTLTLHLADVPFNEAFRTILSMTNLSTTQVGDNILRILTPGALAKAQSAAATVTKVLPLNYTKASEILSMVNQVRLAQGRSTGVALSDAKTNSLVVTDSIEGLAETERLVAQLDVRPKQVLIEVKLIEVSLNNSLHYGIQWDYKSLDPARIGGKQGTNLIGTNESPVATAQARPLDLNATPAVVGPGAGGRGTGVSLPASSIFGALTIGRITNTYFLSATLSAAATQGKVKVLSDPKVATLNNQAANINVTTSIPYVTSNVASTGVQTQTVSYAVTGIQLSVTPSINADGRITLDLNPVVSQPSSTIAASATGAPAVDSRNAKTTILVRDGETIVIGGLISDTMSNTIAKVPLLGDIPLLGWFFKKKALTRTRNELLIFVTTKILQD
ncbi:MAG: type IV pilus secretin PilQ [Elusimicrobia bacterium]|nr:type IV pilus secretin PilQ [Elusimicrobiota bacterium]